MMIDEMKVMSEKDLEKLMKELGQEQLVKVKVEEPDN